MGEYQTLIHTLALTMGVAWASGINLYAAVAVLGLAGNAGYVHLPDTLAIVEDPLVILAACFMYCVEFFADKVPGVDSTWDAVHTFIRIPAGAMLAAGAVGDVTPALAVAAGLVGGSVTAATHATKAGTRMLINTSPEPFSNWAVSLGEDALAISLTWLAATHPMLALGLAIVLTVAAVWVIVLFVRLLRGMKRRVFGSG